MFLYQNLEKEIFLQQEGKKFHKMYAFWMNDDLRDLPNIKQSYDLQYTNYEIEQFFLRGT